MTDKKNYIERTLDQRRSSEKFDYYFLGLIVGLLSLSIYGLKPNLGLKSIYLLIVAWISLIISGAMGFLRLQLVLILKNVDLSKEDNPLLAKKYNVELNKINERYYKHQIRFFYLGIVFYITFRLTNVYCMHRVMEFSILVVAIAIGYLAYKKFRNLIKNIPNKK